MRLLGIDPGATGSAALYDRDKTPASGLRWLVIDLPVVAGELNVAAFRDWLRRHSPDHCFLERVQPMRGWGMGSSWKFSGSFHSVRTVVSCCDIPLTLVVPTVWKKHHGLLKTEKDEARLRALQLFPDQAQMLERKRDQNRADAMLIAAYGVAKLSGS